MHRHHGRGGDAIRRGQVRGRAGEDDVPHAFGGHFLRHRRDSLRPDSWQSCGPAVRAAAKCLQDGHRQFGQTDGGGGTLLRVPARGAPAACRVRKGAPACELPRAHGGGDQQPRDRDAQMAALRRGTALQAVAQCVCDERDHQPQVDSPAHQPHGRAGLPRGGAAHGGRGVCEHPLADSDSAPPLELERVGSDGFGVSGGSAHRSLFGAQQVPLRQRQHGVHLDAIHGREPRDAHCAKNSALRLLALCLRNCGLRSDHPWLHRRRRRQFYG
mmetsp:Transcript_23286/g.38933  ORF Transcript_23286/g.38933 Transcript_23286/m.38933 type:complete len:271 (+) Transcript_23286:2163-2975(+)